MTYIAVALQICRNLIRQNWSSTFSVNCNYIADLAKRRTLQLACGGYTLQPLNWNIFVNIVVRRTETRALIGLFVINPRVHLTVIQSLSLASVETNIKWKVSFAN